MTSDDRAADKDRPPSWERKIFGVMERRAATRSCEKREKTTHPSSRGRLPPKKDGSFLAERRRKKE